MSLMQQTDKNRSSFKTQSGFVVSFINRRQDKQYINTSLSPNFISQTDNLYNMIQQQQQQKISLTSPYSPIHNQPQPSFNKDMAHFQDNHKVTSFKISPSPPKYTNPNTNKQKFITHSQAKNDIILKNKRSKRNTDKYFETSDQLKQYNKVDKDVIQTTEVSIDERNNGIKITFGSIPDIKNIDQYLNGQMERQGNRSRQQQDWFLDGVWTKKSQDRYQKCLNVYVSEIKERENFAKNLKARRYASNPNRNIALTKYNNNLYSWIAKQRQENNLNTQASLVSAHNVTLPLIKQQQNNWYQNNSHDSRETKEIGQNLNYTQDYNIKSLERNLELDQDSSSQKNHFKFVNEQDTVKNSKSKQKHY